MVEMNENGEIERAARAERAKRLLVDGKHPVTREEAERSARTASRLEANDVPQDHAARQAVLSFANALDRLSR